MSKVAKVVVVTGIPGVGKTTVLDGALELVNEEGGNFSYANYGDAMFEIVKKEGLAEKRDDMRKLPDDVQKRIQKQAAKEISQRAGNKIVDTHCTIKTPKGYLPGLPKWVLEELCLTQFVLIEADPKEIAKRRSRDKSRKRDEELEGSISEHQEMNRAVSMSYAMFSGAPVKIIENAELKKAVIELAEALKDG